MPRRLIESGRLEIKGAGARFKQKGTLQAHDENLAHLTALRARATPLPQAKLFLDFEFESVVFRVWQEATLVSYKDFLEKVEFSGIENFRALVRYAGNALEAGARDAATEEFAAGKPPERFANTEELALYDEAVRAGTPPPAPMRGVASTAAAPAAGETERRARAEAAWTQFSADIERAKSERKRPEAPLIGGMVSFIGVVVMAISLRTWVWTRSWDDTKPQVQPLLALGMLTGLALVVVGIVFVRRSARPANDPD
jgi:hypothetical protein